ncbi:unnamed protein product [Calicophoron daubneyi]|uniref:Solute carrier family 43 member 3 n=1 Tax=Calicophoron daubneyi TaxID=300641 RepID=A0AAV2TYC6_CALDB
MFEYVFILATFGQLLFVPLGGLMMDKLGLRVSKLVATALMCTGTMLFAFSKESTSEYLFGGSLIVAVSSNINLICNHQGSSMFPKFRGLVVALISGAYDSCTTVTTVASKLYPRISLQTYFTVLAWSALACGTFVALFILTERSVDMEKLAATNYSGSKEEDAEGNSGGINKRCQDEVEISGAINVDNTIRKIIFERYPTLKSCICSCPFLLVTLYFSLSQVRFSYFLATLQAQLNYAFSDPTIVNEMLVTAIAFTGCGILMGPVSGLLMDFCRLKTQQRIRRILEEPQVKTNLEKIYWIHVSALAIPVTILATSSLTISCLVFVTGSKVVYYVAFLVFLLFRSLLFSTVANMLLISFPIENYGLTYGILCLTGGVFSALQFALKQAPILVSNGICLLISILSFIPPTILFIKGR